MSNLENTEDNLVPQYTTLTMDEIIEMCMLFYKQGIIDGIADYTEDEFIGKEHLEKYTDLFLAKFTKLVPVSFTDDMEFVEEDGD